jgi:hypothetical protein
MKTNLLPDSRFLIPIMIVAMVSCNRKFDAPPDYATLSIQANTTIQALKAMHTSGGFDSISTDIIISGIVSADDKSGNIYKTIYLQDSTGGIAVLLNRSYLYGDYPVGRELFIKCKGLWLSEYGKCIQLGYIDESIPGNPASTGIPGSLLDAYLIKGTLGNTVIPKIVTIAQLNSAAFRANNNPSSDTLQSTLIQLSSVQFQTPGLIYADTSANKLSVSRTLSDCANNTTVAYTSGFADFAGLPTPSGNGRFTAIYIPFRTTSELIIRDTSDIQLTGTGCNYAELTIAQLREIYGNGNGNVTIGNAMLRGVVISDAVNKNLSAGTIILQNASSGIALFFGSSANTAIFNVGDSIEVNITGGVLQKFNGALEISLNASALPTSKLATGVAVTPRRLTAAQISAQIADIEYTLVKMVSSTVSAGIFSGNHTLTDATGSITLYTATSATFANNTLPTASSDWVGYPSRFNTLVELQIRNLNDVTTNTSGGGSSTSGNGIELTSAPFTINFDEIGAGLPQGVGVYLSATPSSLGTAGTFATANASWSATSAGFKNYASATDLTSTSTTANQSASSNRALGIRQTGATGYDPGASFTFQINNTTGKSTVTMKFLLQSLDASVGRTVTWTVDYGIGNNPVSFVPVTTSPAVLTTGPTWTSTPVTINFPSALNNVGSTIWIRISAFAASAGSSSRPTTAIDDIEFTWQ